MARELKSISVFLWVFFGDVPTLNMYGLSGRKSDIAVECLVVHTDFLSIDDTTKHKAGGKEGNEQRA